MSNKPIHLYSNPAQVRRLARKDGENRYFYEKRKKIHGYNTGWHANFGQMGYEDFTKHKNKTQRKNYLTRARKIKGDWKKNKYSANIMASQRS